jgi:hypothetical protein
MEDGIPMEQSSDDNNRASRGDVTGLSFRYISKLDRIMQMPWQHRLWKIRQAQQTMGPAQGSITLGDMSSIFFDKFSIFMNK